MVWAAWSGALLQTLAGHRDSVFSALYSPAGDRIVTSSADQTAKVWAAGSETVLLTLEGHTGWVRSTDFRPINEKFWHNACVSFSDAF